MNRILVIDDEQSIRELLKDFLETKGFEVSTAPDGESGLELLKEDKFDLFLLDLMMPGISGLDVLREKESEKIDIPCIVITAHASVQTAVEAMKLGAYDYLPKPFVLEDVYITIKRALDVSKLQEENTRLKKQLQKRFGYKKIIGKSIQIESVIKFIEKIADTDSTVLITGESGTGKELVSNTIHFNSSRAKKPFVPLNCAAIPKDILESELFGHEKGAFTGAVTTRIGRFELANQGTLFLDEIGELAPALQVKLLRVLQEREFERVGGIKTIKTDVRIIAATNRDLEKAVKDGDFREDLYYRLNVIPLHLPPLRKMKDDIPLLIDYFNATISKSKKMDSLSFSKEAMKYLTDYQWPGNVRELENLVERLIILSYGSSVEPDDLPERIREKVPVDSASRKDQLSPDGVDLNIMLDEIENNMIVQALEISRGVKSKAAGLLGLNRTTLIEKMKKKAIEFNAS
jgi:DNA-binding NtrC family response regulator